MGKIKDSIRLGAAAMTTFGGRFSGSWKLASSSADASWDSFNDPEQDGFAYLLIDQGLLLATVETNSGHFGEGGEGISFYFLRSTTLPSSATAGTRVNSMRDINRDVQRNRRA